MECLTTGRKNGSETGPVDEKIRLDLPILPPISQITILEELFGQGALSVGHVSDSIGLPISSKIDGHLIMPQPSLFAGGYVGLVKELEKLLQEKGRLNACRRFLHGHSRRIVVPDAHSPEVRSRLRINEKNGDLKLALVYAVNLRLCKANELWRLSCTNLEQGWFRLSWCELLILFLTNPQLNKPGLYGSPIAKEVTYC